MAEAVGVQTGSSIRCWRNDTFPFYPRCQSCNLDLPGVGSKLHSRLTTGARGACSYFLTMIQMEHHLDLPPADASDRIRLLNRKYRLLVPYAPDLMLSSLVRKTLGDFLPELFIAIRDFDDFHEGNNPYGEEDFGSVTIRGHEIWWKIDYYDRFLGGGSPDPSDASLTRRVMTIFLPEEY